MTLPEDNSKSPYDPQKLAQIREIGGDMLELPIDAMEVDALVEDKFRSLIKKCVDILDDQNIPGDDRYMQFMGKDGNIHTISMRLSDEEIAHIIDQMPDAMKRSLLGGRK